ncbi:MAG TPA: class II fumarate hydratase [Burkholderiaceae bacterium]|nr:class II fumarate hydratase [Burkholderiaceae bacterium]
MTDAARPAVPGLGLGPSAASYSPADAVPDDANGGVGSADLRSRAAPRTRIERDSLGEVEVPADAPWGAQTQRAIGNFPISTERWAPELIDALVLVKRSAALAHRELGTLPATLATAIAEAADEVLAGRHRHAFPLPVWQTGSGTQTNMNVNEVLAHLATRRLADPDRGRVHPNDHVNRGQSSNDAVPAAIHVATALALARRVEPALHELAAALRERERAFAHLVKIGRTHLQDAVPMTLGQAFGAYASQIERARRAIAPALDDLLPLPVGGTAIGSGLNAPPGFAEAIAAQLATATGLPFTAASDRFALIGAHDPVVAAHAAMSGAAVALTRIGNDLRLMSSGPDTGLGEIRLPANEPGSSIMPGKVNPTQVEALTMACLQVMGNHGTMQAAGAGGMLELNVYKPLIGHLAMQSARLVADATRSFVERCVRGIEADEARLAMHVSRSRMLVTALAPHVGYDAAARIVHRAVDAGSTLREAAIAEGVTAEDYDRWVDPAAMAGLGGTERGTEAASPG